jgi:uncharacterized membrane protein YcaP (DUF421 family)
MTLFQSWEEIGRIVVTAVVAYLAVVLFVRIMGKRSTSKMNNFDWVITVALGSVVGSMILFEDVVLMDGIMAIFTLFLLQYLVTWTSVRMPTFMRGVHARPTLLFYKGQFLDEQMKRERVLPQEVLSAIRAQGYSSLENVSAVILESSADLSIIGNAEPIESILLDEVMGVPTSKMR